eukprot:m.56518 g.56518  ORF g.56518 m.56518 type:complete len:375 (+) comp13395_c1_seq1:247-1371(+)
MNRRDVQLALLAHELLDDDDFDYILISIYRRAAERNALRRIRQQSPPFIHWVHDISSDMYRALFRFEREDIDRLACALQLPVDGFHTVHRCSVPRLVALHLLLFKLAYPHRHVDLSALVYYSNAWVRDALYAIESHIFSRFRHLLDAPEQLCSPPLLEAYAESLLSMGSLFCGDNPARIFSFMDGTATEVLRPSHDEAIFFSGYKWMHAFNWLAVSLPSGMIWAMFGPFFGSDNDAGNWQLLTPLQHRLRLAPFVRRHPDIDRRYLIYCDGGFALTDVTARPFVTPVTPDHSFFNERMASLRVEVEHAFAGLVNKWKGVHFVYQNHANETFYREFMVCSLLENAWNCMYKNQTSRRFRVDPPDLITYFSIPSPH